MSEEAEFIPSTLDAVMGEVADEPQETVVEEKPEVKVEEPVEEVKADEVKEEAKAEPEEKTKLDNVVAMREVIASQKAKITELTKKDPDPAPDVFEDPDGFREHMTKDFDNKLSKNKAEMSESMARQQFDDYDVISERFFKELAESPELGAKVRASSHPAMEVYNQGKRLLQLDDIGDPAEFKARMKAEILAELKTEPKEEPLKETKLPDDLTSETNAGARKGPNWAGPTDLGKLFPD